MAYVVLAELLGRYPAITKWGADSSYITDDLIYYAETELNSRFASHFSVPFSAAHPTIKDLTLDLAYYRSLRTTDSKRAKEIHEAVIGRIDKIKAGEEYIYTGSYTTISAETTTQTIWSNTMGYHPVHSMLGTEHEDTHVSSDLLDALESERS